MLTTLVTLTLRGSLIFLLVWAFEQTLRRRMRARGRRAWWWLVTLGFLLPSSLPFVPPLPPSALDLVPGVRAMDFHATAQTAASFVSLDRRDAWLSPTLLSLWAAGGGFSLALVVWCTLRTRRRWVRERLCTRPALLELLEDCKATAGISVPLGLIVSDAAPSPALLGWLRPRILLPATLADELPRPQLRAVLLHELAHLRAADLMLHWVFTAAAALNWFNPLLHLAVRQWLHFRELAADEMALHWLYPPERPDYGAALIATLKRTSSPAPFGALALGESFATLKQRITMITRHSKSVRPLPE